MSWPRPLFGLSYMWSEPQVTCLLKGPSAGAVFTYVSSGVSACFLCALWEFWYHYCFTDFSVTVIKYCAQGNLKKEVHLGLIVSE